MKQPLLLTFQLPDAWFDTLNRINTKYVKSGMRYGWKADNALEYDQGHWNRSILYNSWRKPYGHEQLPMLDSHPDIKHLWNTVKRALGSDRELFRCYINGYTYGTDGYAHKDDEWIKRKYGEDALSETVIVYLNNKWDIDWAGETVVFNDDKEIVLSVLPKFGRVFIFDSNLLHAARPVSRICNVLRSVVVFKTIDPKINDPRVQFILDKTKGISHSGKTFFEHLFNTMTNLELDKKNSNDLCVAGLYHSIYGTEFYKFNDPTITRDQIKELIGDYAENLVWLFCKTEDRINAFIDNTIGVDEKIRQDLIRLELANLYDQRSNQNTIYRLEKELII